MVDIWDDSISDPADELGLWKDMKFHLSAKDHWVVNGILPKISEWQKFHSDSILWISSPYMGRDSWLTQFSLDLIHAAQTEGHILTFALCDRPEGHRLTFICLLKQLICQVVHNRPQLVMEAPSLFTPRSIRKATTLRRVMEIFERIVEKLEILLVIIDRIDLCQAEQDGLLMLQHLSDLSQSRNGTLRILITSAEDLPDSAFADLAISIVKVNLKKKKKQVKKPDFLRGAQMNRRFDPLRPVYTRMARAYLSIRTLNRHFLDYFFDDDPSYIIIKRWGEIF